MSFYRFQDETDIKLLNLGPLFSRMPEKYYWRKEFCKIWACSYWMFNENIINIKQR